MLKEGEAAPDFVLKDADGRDVRLSRFLGKPVVVYFYPRDNTVGCTIQAKGFRDSMADIEGRGAVLLGISMDSAEKHCAFRDKYQLTYRLLSDPDGRVHDLYDAWLTTLFGKRQFAVRRCTYVIDAQGIIRKVYRHVNPVGHAKDVSKDLEGLLARRAA